MKSIILNTSDCTGGAAVAAGRLMKALQKCGVDCRMLVRDKRMANPNVLSLNHTFISRKINFVRFTWERLVIFLSNKLSRENLFQISIANTGADISQSLWIQEADIIHLHWINQGFLSLQDIKKLIQTGKPIVWTMHDLWSATGICHYPNKCTRYHTACYKCPLQAKHSLIDLAKLVYRKKQEIDFSKITFVGCSEWIVLEAKKSKLLQNARFTSIPNPIDISVFQPVDKKTARKRFGLPMDKQLILFAAAKLSDGRKGATYLVEACNILQKTHTNRIELVLMGNSVGELTDTIPFKVNSLGYLSDIESIVLAYASADMFIIPSLEDNLPNTIMESMACGTPCVGFKTGGIPEMIDHKVNGYVAKYKDAEDLAIGIEWVLENKDTLNLSEACVKKVEVNYAETIVASKYIELYNTLESSYGKNRV